MKRYKSFTWKGNLEPTFSELDFRKLYFMEQKRRNNSQHSLEEIFIRIDITIIFKEKKILGETKRMHKMEKWKVMIIMVALVFSAIIPVTAAEDEPEEPTMIYGTSSLVVDMDPHYAWDSASSAMIEQIMEGLFSYDLRDKNLAYQPCLAKDFGTWEEGAEGFHGKQWKYTVDLKTNITFHDGSAFEADDVKYSFDRLNALCTIGVNGKATQIQSLYTPLGSTYPATPLLINATNIIDKDTVELILNYKYAALEPLLCFTGSVIMPKDKYPINAYLDKTTDVLIGTGPYTQVSHTPDLTKFAYFEDFRGAYGQKAPEIRKMEYKLYSDAYSKNQDFLAGDIDATGGFYLEFMDQIENSSLHVVGDRMQGTSISFIGFDMNHLDLNTRKALRSAINYSKALEIHGGDDRAQLTSLVPKGILYHDESIDAPAMNLAEARAFIIAAVDAGEKLVSKPVGWDALKYSTDDSDWEAVTIVSINHYYNWNNDVVKRDTEALLKSNFAKIGVHLNVEGLNFQAYLTALKSGEMDMYNLGWGPDFNDPSNYIDNLAGSASPSNAAHVNDSVLDDLIAQGIAETDHKKREQLYQDMQQRIVALSVFAFMSTSNVRSVYNLGCQNTARNGMGKLYWYLWTFDAGANFYNTNFGIIPSFSTLTLISVCTLSLSILGQKATTLIKKKR